MRTHLRAFDEPNHDRTCIAGECIGLIRRETPRAFSHRRGVSPDDVRSILVKALPRAFPMARAKRLSAVADRWLWYTSGKTFIACRGGCRMCARPDAWPLMTPAPTMEGPVRWRFDELGSLCATCVVLCKEI